LSPQDYTPCHSFCLHQVFGWYNLSGLGILKLVLCCCFTYCLYYLYVNYIHVFIIKTGLADKSSELEDYHLDCCKCKKPLLVGEVAVLAERAGEQAAWHPQCFVCSTCEVSVCMQLEHSQNQGYLLTWL
jgi:hypothetical protein